MASGLEESGVHPSANKRIFERMRKLSDNILEKQCKQNTFKILQKRLERKVEEEVSATQAGVRRKKWYT